MSLITIDFETYYDRTFSLSRLTTEEYIRGESFQVIGVSVKVDDALAVWHSGTREELTKWLRKFDWKNSSVLAHNMLFDGAILCWYFKIPKPKLFLDTLCMARALHGVEVGGSLAKLAVQYKIGEKGTEVLDAKGLRLEDFTKESLAQYGRYCCNDVELTYKLFNIFIVNFPDNELKLIDITISMFTHPKFYVDEKILHERMIDLIEERKQLLSSLKGKLGCESDEEVSLKLSSNPKFAQVLKDFGVTVPTKISERTGKVAPALSKKDEGFLALMSHEDTFIQSLCAARLGVKSTIEENRIQRFIDIGRRNGESLPIPLKYYGAHTGRWSGSDKVNFQNLPSRDKKKKALKNAIIAPDGYMVINSDSAQIEARVLAWFAGQDDVVKMFVDKVDVYRVMAAKIYKCKPEEVTAEQRFIGKTVVLGCGYGTGWAKLQATLATSSPPMTVDEVEARRIIEVYRDANHKVRDLWTEGDALLSHMIDGVEGGEVGFGEHKCVGFDSDGIILPNTLRIVYKLLHRNTEEVRSKIVHNSRKGEISIWGGTVVENVVQALARCIIGEQLVKINAKYKVALTVHDSVVVVVPADECAEAEAWITGIMSIAPDWAPGLPVSCETKSGLNYGDC
jgi:DNA polymerase